MTSLSFDLAARTVVATGKYRLGSCAKGKKVFRRRPAAYDREVGGASVLIKPTDQRLPDPSVEIAIGYRGDKTERRNRYNSAWLGKLGFDDMTPGRACSNSYSQLVLDQCSSLNALVKTLVML